ncbi:hypothetical protein PVK06_048544 [Gossypium arboreum]|uniref:Uncharacterized protein n=1 Tax=Gossypium arboreum TaxID=29729 RepID=A0ABR0MGQ5_GOSAR|nr:hypothetical protein PVK06_048544 [Gossypium arboreum]
MARKVQTLRGVRISSFFHRFEHLGKLVNFVLRSLVEKEGHEPSHLEQFRFQHLQKDWSDKLSSEVAEQVYVRNNEKALLEEAKSRFCTEAAEREAYLIAEVEEKYMKLTEIQEAKFMDMMDAHEKKYKTVLN